jgi:hypothetical protein
MAFPESAAFWFRKFATSSTRRSCLESQNFAHLKISLYCTVSYHLLLPIACRLSPNFVNHSQNSHECLADVQANAGRYTFVNGVQGLHPSVDLMFIEMPDNLVVPGLGEQPPTWNQLTVEYEDWYDIVLDFALKYLKDDGGILFILPIGFVSDLEEKVQSFGIEVNVDWLCHQLLPLTHPHYDQKQVSSSTIPLFHRYFVE